jgi:hypothetical protein
MTAGAIDIDIQEIFSDRGVFYTFSRSGGLQREYDSSGVTVL